MNKVIRIGTRDSQLAIWQATHVQNQLKDLGVSAELILIKSEGDIDLHTPLYAMGVQGVFTKTLDAALLSGRIDCAVHSMKDVPVQLAQGIHAAAVLPRANHLDLLVVHPSKSMDSIVQDLGNTEISTIIGTSSIRRKAQWLKKYPHHKIENLRGNVNTRLKKLSESNWMGAIFAAAGLERIDLRPVNSIELDWMLPAPAQGAITVVCLENDSETSKILSSLHHPPTASCVEEERAFLNTLMGGCSTPISAWARIEGEEFIFTGNVTTPDGTHSVTVDHQVPLENALGIGRKAAKNLMHGEEWHWIQKIKT